MTILTTDTRHYYKRRELVPGWVVSTYKFSGTPSLNDTIEFFSANHHGLYVADWFIGMEQCDTNGAPTLTISIGLLATNGLTVDTTTGYRWVTNSAALGRTAAPSLLRATDAYPMFTPVPSRRIGIEFTGNAATAAFTGKHIYMGVLFQVF
jgi:hypothetical protein